jgi:hypothetical protein
VRSLLGLITHNWKLKLSAFALAILLWLTVTADQVAIRWLMVPVEVELRDPNHQLLDGPQPREVQVRISGPRREFWDLGLNRPQLRLVLRDVEAGTHSYPLEPQLVQIPRRVARGLTPIDVAPGRVTLTFQRVATATVPLRVEVGTPPRDGYAIVDTLQAQPVTVTISGPAERVQAVQAVRTQALNLAREEGVFQQTVSIDTTGLGGLRLSHSQAIVSGRIEPAVQQLVVEVPVQSPPGVLVVPGAVDVQLWGAESTVRRLSAAGLRVVIPPGSIPASVPAGGVSAPVRVEPLPPGVRAVAEPRMVRVLAAPELPLPQVQPPTLLPPGTPRPPAEPGEPEDPPGMEA